MGLDNKQEACSSNQCALAASGIRVRLLSPLLSSPRGRKDSRHALLLMTRATCCSCRFCSPLHQIPGSSGCHVPMRRETATSGCQRRFNSP
ncbi:hypothetical protein GUJ93_ZPchr0006g45760 [Zizania palustris]|uniref:Uncharacterized protein n=1 Tax=Zizania palustris TaxID=103762 RepID=A0A8J5SN79_ZIZPA|nr:hypothetical protein GUJ93_ZPchr0006g45760 [Zizania palustris]